MDCYGGEAVQGGRIHCSDDSCFSLYKERSGSKYLGERNYLKKPKKGTARHYGVGLPFLDGHYHTRLDQWQREDLTEKLRLQCLRDLRKVLGSACRSYEVLLSFIRQCEDIINLRKIMYISNDPKDLIALTSAMFLRDIL